MSIFISIKYADCIKLLTDGAVYDRDMIIRRVMPKVWTAKSLPLAITGRGNLYYVENIAKEAVAFCNKAGSVDATLAWLEFAATRLRVHRDALCSNEMHFEVVVAARSETNGFLHTVMCTFDGNSVEPFKWHSQPDIARGCPDIDPSRLAITVPPTDPRFLQLHAVPMMELMRQQTDWAHDDISLHERSDVYGAVCGGLATLTTITKTGATSETLKVWNDPVGERVDPYREFGNVTIMGNRKQRRWAAKEAREQGRTKIISRH